MEQAAHGGRESQSGILPNLSARALHRNKHDRPAERVVVFYNHRAAAGQYIKGSTSEKGVVTWTRPSCFSCARCRHILIR
jgi:hypothetical protein